MIAKKTYENMDFLRGGHPYDTLKIGKAELRILDKLIPIAKELGLLDIGVEDLNKKKAIASWGIPSVRGYRGGRITFFRNTDKPERDFDYGIFIMGKHGTDVQDWRKWDTLEKWKQNIGFMYESVSFERGGNPKHALGIGVFSKLEELAKFLEEDLRWNGAKVSVNPDGSLRYKCMAGQSVIPDIKKTIEKFGWGEMMKINIDDGCSRAYPDCTEHYYKISFKKPFAKKMGLLENIDFQRGQEPKEALNIGKRRKIKAGDKFIVKKYQSDKTIEVEAAEDESYYDGNPNSLPYWEIMCLTPKGDLKYAFKYSENDDWEIEELFESQNFERGQDPKDAMKIGNIANAVEIEASPYIDPKEIIPYFKDPSRDCGIMFSYFDDEKGHKHVVFLSDLRENHPDVIFRGKYYNLRGNSVKESAEFIRGEDPMKSMDIGVRPIEIVYAEAYIGNRSEPSPMGSRSIKAALKNWIPGQMGDWSFWATGHKFYLADQLEGKWVKFKGELYKLGVIDESVHFERGKDPREALGIGNELYRHNLEKLKLIKNAFPDITEDPELYASRLTEMNVKLGNFMPVGHLQYGVNWINSRGVVQYRRVSVKSEYENQLFSLISGLIRSIEENIKPIGESANFIRGIDPKRALEIGLPPKMGEGYTVLWRDRRNKWSIERYTNPYTKEPNLVIVSDDYIDYPILYDDGRIAYDNPYRLPKDVRDRAHKLYLKIKGFNESLDFERGLDTKEKLRIGKDWHKNKIMREFKKVTDFYNEPWMEKIFPELAKELDDLGIELIRLDPHIEQFSFTPAKEVITVFWKGSGGKDLEDTVNVGKKQRFGKEEQFSRNARINVLYPVIDTIKWHEHNLMK